MEAFDALTLPQRVVLLAVTDLDAGGETPAHANAITSRCRELTDAVEDIGALTEAEVNRALNSLEAEGLVTVPSMDDTSPTGKGRPAYTLAADAGTVREELGEDKRLSGLGVLH